MDYVLKMKQNRLKFAILITREKKIELAVSLQKSDTGNTEDSNGLNTLYIVFYVV